MTNTVARLLASLTVGAVLAAGFTLSAPATDPCAPAPGEMFNPCAVLDLARVDDVRSELVTVTMDEAGEDVWGCLTDLSHEPVDGVLAVPGPLLSVCADLV